MATASPARVSAPGNSIGGGNAPALPRTPTLMNHYRWALLPALLLYLPQMTAWAQQVQTAANADNADYAAIIQHAATRYGVEVTLLRAVIKVESNFNPKAVSATGAIGLMQVQPATAADYGVEQRDALFDPQINVDIGTRHLKRLLKKYKNIHRALTAYNAGEGNEVQFRRTGAFTETRKYTVSVIRYYQQYKGH